MRLEDEAGAVALDGATVDDAVVDAITAAGAEEEEKEEEEEEDAVGGFLSLFGVRVFWPCCCFCCC